MEARRWRVEGRVQGVGFRDRCARHARALGLAGWVRNRYDGSVEVLAQGPADMLARLDAWLQHGMPPARVDRLTGSAAEPDPTLGDRFEQRPTA